VVRTSRDIRAELESRRSPIPAVAQAKRRAAGVDQAWAAAQIGVHRVTLARWEEGRCVPRCANRERWIALLSVFDDVTK
jgi:hypothetical protein